MMIAGIALRCFWTIAVIFATERLVRATRNGAHGHAWYVAAFTLAAASGLFELIRGAVTDLPTRALIAAATLICGLAAGTYLQIVRTRS